MRKLIVSAAIAGLIAGGAAVVKAETLVVGHRTLPVNQGDVHMAFSALAVNPIMAFFDSLTYNDQAGNTNPGLVTSWENTAPDTWILKVRPGVKFHNGKPVTAEAIAFNIRYLMTDEGRVKSAARQVKFLASATAIDDNTVEVKTKKPNPIFYSQAAIIRIVEPTAYSEGIETFSRNPVGTGAFRVTNWAPDRIEAVAFDNGWRKPKVDALTIIELPEVASRIQALLSGQVDMALDVGPEAIETIENAGGQVIVSPTHNIMTLMINSVREGPLQDVRIRQAMNYGVNKQVFIDTVLRGLVRAAGQPLKMGDVGYNPNVKPYPYDPEKAKQLLAEAGYPNGIKLTAEVVTSLGEFSSAQQHIASDLAKVGIDLELKVITTPILIKKILNQQPWDGDAFSMQFESYPTGDGGRPMDTHSCNFFFDSRWICDKAIMPTIIALGSEMDPQKRVAMLQEAMQYYHDNALALFMYERAQFDAMSGDVKNYELVNRAINWHELELTR